MATSELDNLLRRIGLRIVELRLGRGWSREDLAHQLEVTPRYLARIEGGRQNLTVERLLWLAATLDVRIDDLFAAPAIDAIPVGRPRRS